MMLKKPPRKTEASRLVRWECPKCGASVQALPTAVISHRCPQAPNKTRGPDRQVTWVMSA